MNQALLLDGIVRETARLIATLATAGNSSVSVGHLSELFFVSLADELIEGQGKSQKVAADLFLLPLRTFRYRLKTRRESSTHRGKTLWRVVFEHLQANGPVKHMDLEQRFDTEDQKMLWSIVRDMIECGLVFQSGSGRHRRYMAVGAPRFEAEASEEADDHITWVAVYTHPRATAEELAEALGIPGSAMHLPRLDQALQRLLDDGRIVMTDDAGDAPRYESPTLDLQPEWDGPFAAVYDHFRGMTRTLRERFAADADLDPCGGATFRFEIWDGHPSADEVEGLLADTRRRMGRLIEQVDAIDPPISALRRRVLFYFGQSSGARVEPSVEQ